MNEERFSEIRQAIVKILEEYNIMSAKDFETMDEDTGCELYESLKAGILEEFNLDNDEMDAVFDKVLESD